jgi:hypothetical protein
MAVTICSMFVTTTKTTTRGGNVRNNNVAILSENVAALRQRRNESIFLTRYQTLVNLVFFANSLESTKRNIETYLSFVCLFIQSKHIIYQTFKGLNLKIQCKPLNGMTLGQRETDFNNRPDYNKRSFGICTSGYYPIDNTSCICDPIKWHPMFFKM